MTKKSVSKDYCKNLFVKFVFPFIYIEKHMLRKNVLN